MEKPLHEQKTRLLLWTAIAIIATLITSIVLYRVFTEAPTRTGPLLDDPENDVILSIGTEYPGMIDVLRAALEVNGTALSITINVKDSISDLSAGENAQWNLTIILENDINKTYEVCAELNSTQLSGHIAKIGESNISTCEVNSYRNSLTIHPFIEELPNAKEVQWFILTTFEKLSGNELISSASDIAPDEGLQRTVLNR